IWVLQNPEAVTISPEHQIALNDYYAALQINQTVSKSLELDFTISAYGDQTNAAWPVFDDFQSLFQFQYPPQAIIASVDETMAIIALIKEGDNGMKNVVLVQIHDENLDEYALQDCLRDSPRTYVEMIGNYEFYVRDGLYGPSNDLDAVQEEWDMRYATAKGSVCVSFSFVIDDSSSYEELLKIIPTFKWTISEPEWPDPVIAAEELLPGTIVGRTRNPTGPYFSGRVEAVNINTGEMYWTDEFTPGDRFEIADVTPGIYQLIAYDHTEWPFGYTEWSICEWDRDSGNPDECNWASHELLEVYVFAEQVTSDILIYDYDAPALIEKYTDYYD
ncbi:MAG: hypothetical protein V3R57_04150, partial [Candidatus Bathyarchaeia archaeon]